MNTTTVSDPYAADSEVTDVLAGIVSSHEPEPMVATSSAPQLWRDLASTEMLWIGVDEREGGSGGSIATAGEMIRLTGYHASAGLIAETGLLGAWLLGRAGLAHGGVPLAVVVDRSGLTARPDGDGWILDGRADRVAWAGEATTVVAVLPLADGELVAAVPVSAVEVVEGHNLAQERRDSVRFPGVRVDATSGKVVRVSGGLPRLTRELELRAAMARSLQIAGAAERALDLTIGYATQRHQFGRPIAAFQAVQQLISLMAEEAALARAAGEEAARAFTAYAAEPDSAAAFQTVEAAVATAKSIAAASAGIVAAHAHQVHGAMGFTNEYSLQLLTKRLWSWRDEYGSGGLWSRQLSAQLDAALGQDSASVAGPVWTFVTEAV